MTLYEMTVTIRFEANSHGRAADIFAGELCRMDKHCKERSDMEITHSHFESDWGDPVTITSPTEDERIELDANHLAGQFLADEVERAAKHD